MTHASTDRAGAHHGTGTPKILILGAGRGQVGLIRAAKKLGYDVSVASLLDGPPPGLALADHVIEADITSPDAVLSAIEGHHFDGVATCCADTPLAALAAVAHARDLRGLTPTAAHLCHDKQAMKKTLSAAGVPTAKYITVATPSDLDDFAHEVGFPLVVKATDLQGSNGVFIVHSLDDAHAAFTRAAELSPSGSVIAEEFLTGQEIGAQACIADGEVLFVLPHGDETIERDTNVPVGHYVPLTGQHTANCVEQHPYSINAVTATAITEAVTAAIHALGLDNCAVNVDLMLNDGKVTIIELTGRAGANCLIETCGPYLGVDYYEFIARLATGDRVKEMWDARTPTQAAVWSRMLYSHTTGVVDHLAYTGEDPRVLEAGFYRHTGDEVHAFRTSHDCIGHLVVAAPTLDGCKEALDLAESHVCLEFTSVD